MALKPCKECGAPVSDKANACPKCGAKVKKMGLLLKIILWFFAITIVMGVISNLTKDNKGTVNDKESSASSAVNEDENKAAGLSFIIQDRIKNSAKDPSSVQFRNEQYHHDKDYGAIACGEFNGKNSFGAYGGFKGYVAVEKDEKLYIEDSVNAKDFPKKWNKFCVTR
ncbi:zinc ribbon domain-containing protein [Acinetobacter baumannii]|uniref:zinc ribbon domain-containing protein n=1 Tax=Acinetobacter baumannii TaxID=470 RepID=UPI001D0F2D96